MKCNRYFFSYTSHPIEVKDYITRLADIAVQSYGPNIVWARLLQLLDNARCLGWKIPKFGQHNMPDFFKELTEEGINHIFENQAKLLIDLSPVTHVTLEDFNTPYPVRMVGTSTPAGDLVWKCHLLTDPKSGKPYVWDGQPRYVKTKGTKIVCSVDATPYDENSLVEMMGGSQKGTWPVPFLPEVFSDHPLAGAFSVDGEVVELVSIEEPEPVRVLVNNRVPWYRQLYVDRTKALALSRPELVTKKVEIPDLFKEADVQTKAKAVDAWFKSAGTPEEIDDEHYEVEPDSEEDPEEDTEEPEYEPVTYNNVTVNLSETEYQHLEKLESSLRSSGIASKKDAEKLRKKSLPGTPSQIKAEQWLLTNIKRKALLANASSRIGALFSLLQRHADQPILVLHPKEKWATRLVELMVSKGFAAQLYGKNKNSLLKKFSKGDIPILVSWELDAELFIENIVVVSVSAFSREWTELLNDSHTVYAISLKQLGFADSNLIQENPVFEVVFEEYDGPPLDLLKGVSEETLPEPTEDTSEEKPEEPLLEAQLPPEVTMIKEETFTPTDPQTTEEKVDQFLEDTPSTPAKPKKTKADALFKVVTGKGRPAKASTFEEAKAIAEKKEAAGHSCQILDLQDTVLYTTQEKTA